MKLKNLDWGLLLFYVLFFIGVSLGIMAFYVVMGVLVFYLLGIALVLSRILRED